ncbi:hypothetical protein FDQ49_00180 [Acinetobacter nosocomialis M2]|nr:hypothetical protein CAT69_09445 [Acinetobacter nosocomialis]QCP62425.1 hypothetical protein FDQ49_00180 [Acinetobacter nosocomialis M2]
MSKNLINHKRCPNCDSPIKGYYYYCGRCGNNDVVNWKLTGYFWLLVGSIFLIAMYLVTKNFCSHPFFTLVEFCKYF